MNEPIPVELRGKFFRFMNAADNDYLPEEKWFTLLEDAAIEFMAGNRLRGNCTNAAHQYLRMRLKGNR